MRLGPELNAAHFVLRLGGKCRVHGSSEWLLAKNESDLKRVLPQNRVNNFFLEGLDLSRTIIQYGGLHNIGQSLLEFQSCTRINIVTSLCVSYCRGVFALGDACHQGASLCRRLVHVASGSIVLCRHSREPRARELPARHRQRNPRTRPLKVSKSESSLLFLCSCSCSSSCL